MVNSMKKSKQKEHLNHDHTAGRSTNHINLYNHTMRTLNIDQNRTQVNLWRVGRSYLKFPKPEIGSVTIRADTSITPFCPIAKDLPSGRTASSSHPSCIGA